MADIRQENISIPPSDERNRMASEQRARLDQKARTDLKARLDQSLRSEQQSRTRGAARVPGPQASGNLRPSTPGAVRPVAKTKGTESALRLVLGIVIGVLALLVVAEIVFQVAFAPQMHIRRVSLESDLGISQESVLAAAGIGPDALYYAVQTDQIEQRLASLPPVKEAHVTKIFPDALSIRLVGRTPLVGAIVRKDDGTQVPVQIDSLGVVFREGLSPSQSLPMLSGLEFKNFRPGLSLPRYVVPFLQDLETLRVDSPALYQSFSEFKLVPVSDSQVEILAYTLNSPVGVRINAHINTDTALYILRTLDMLGKTVGLSKIREIDFRTNNVVYKKGDD